MMKLIIEVAVFIEMAGYDGGDSNGDDNDGNGDDC